MGGRERPGLETEGEVKSFGTRERKPPLSRTVWSEHEGT